MCLVESSIVLVLDLLVVSRVLALDLFTSGNIPSLSLVSVVLAMDLLISGTIPSLSLR